MRREEKDIIINSLVEDIKGANHFYIADIGGLDSVTTSKLRRKCFEKNVKIRVVKNTLLKLALEKSDRNTEELYDVLKGETSVMFSEVGNLPAKVIEDFRKEGDKPILKGAFVEESIYIGDDQLKVLSSIKSKDELIGDIIALLQSPAKNVISALQSGGNILTGVLETLSDRKE